ncbi:MAG TPA: FtsQ-type POTRA domain-containing protein, partial [Verrucomicrobiae bacterium]|nr:FtsQ-type POTRA domain-containing protein [Verrucomicrobiae bacterium]
QRWSGVKPGDNLFALDLAKVKQHLEMAPMIQSVSVERILPRTLRIAVTERVPVAQVNVPGLRAGGGVQINVFQLDADGYVMLPLDARDRAVPLSQQTDLLPVIAGIEPTKLQPGRAIRDVPQLQSALELIAAFDHSPMAGLVDLRRVDVSSPQVLVITTDQGSQITFGAQDLDQQLRRWRATFDLGQTQKRVIGTLNLAVDNNIPVCWLDVATPPASPRPADRSPLKTIRKRNV